MFLIDTNVISEVRKRDKANRGVIKFFADASSSQTYLSVVTIGELRRGVELIRNRNDLVQAKQLEVWLDEVVTDYANLILPFGKTEAEVWGALRVPNPENAIDKQIAATALVSDLTLVTRNVNDFVQTGAETLNPFT